MSSDIASQNAFLHQPLGAIFAKTALPIIFVMGMNGLLTVVDAIFLGIYVGTDAVAAVTVTFPIFMLIIALSALVGAGMSSILARHLGAGLVEKAQAVFAGANMLALAFSAVLIVLFLLFGGPLTLAAANGIAPIAGMGHTYLAILIYFSPVFFVLVVNSDALRNEGRAMMMAGLSLLVSIGNIGFNYVLIAILGLGIAGSAWGTVLAQALALMIILAFRVGGQTQLRPSVLLRHKPTTAWREILALGAPQSLAFMGIALVSTAMIAALQLTQSPTYDLTIAAYGICTRVMTFAFLPLLGLSHAMQSIVGNNYGAGLAMRTDKSLRMALGIAFVYCLAIEASFIGFARPIGRMFVDDANVAGEVARLMPYMVASYVLTGPLMMVSTYFQAIGDATRAALLSLTRPYFFTIPLVFILSFAIGETGIWLSGPISEVMLMLLAIVVLAMVARRSGRRWGLFTADNRQV